MPAISRVGVNQAGGIITGPGASTVKAEGARVTLKGDSIAAHGKSPHTAPVMVGASGTVFAEGKPVCRAGDAATCGHNSNGASTVFAG